MPVVVSGDPLPWFIAGPLLGLFVPLLLLLTGKDLGISSSFRHVCASLLPQGWKKRLPYFDYDVRTGAWQILFALGIAFGGFLSVFVLGGTSVDLALDASYTYAGISVLFAGGVLVGFGTRWADGCTSGHTIAGLSNLSWPSLVASVCFVAGGVATSWVHRTFFGGLIP